MFSFAGCFLIWTLPESPRWLLQEHERNKATESLRILRQTNLIDAELDEIEREETTVVVQGVSICTMFTSTRFRWPLITSIVLNTVQQFSGINTVSIKKIIKLNYRLIVFFLNVRYFSIQVKHFQSWVL
jgi:DNA-binding transcriptional regulator YbjK